MTDQTTEQSPFTRDEDGKVTNPPVNPDYERRIQTAANAADETAMAEVQSEYEDWRGDEIARIEQRAGVARDDDPFGGGAP